jgi:hypothetical protein
LLQSLALSIQGGVAPVLVAGPSGLPYFLPNACMDAIKKDARSLFKTAYAREQPRPRYRRDEPYHLGWAFDVAVIVVFLIAVVGYITV